MGNYKYERKQSGWEDWEITHLEKGSPVGKRGDMRTSTKVLKTTKDRVRRDAMRVGITMESWVKEAIAFCLQSGEVNSKGYSVLRNGFVGDLKSLTIVVPHRWNEEVRRRAKQQGGSIRDWYANAIEYVLMQTEKGLMPKQTFTVLTVDGKKGLVEGVNEYDARAQAQKDGLHVAHIAPGDCRTKYEFNNYTGSWTNASELYISNSEQM